MKYEIIKYEVYHESKAEAVTYNKIVDDLEAERKILEQQHCYEKTILGKKKVGSIFFSYKTLK